MNLPATGPNYSYLFDTESMSAWGLLRLREQLENGLPLTPRPYQTLAERTGLSEQQVMNALSLPQQEDPTC